MIGLIFGETYFPKEILKKIKKEIQIFNNRYYKKQGFLKKTNIHTE